jgi:hypothetical protein
MNKQPFFFSLRHSNKYHWNSHTTAKTWNQVRSQVKVSGLIIPTIDSWTLWSTNTPQIMRVPMWDMCLCLTPIRYKYLWLHWIMSFSQIIIGVYLSLPMSYPVSVPVLSSISTNLAKMATLIEQLIVRI